MRDAQARYSTIPAFPGAIETDHSTVTARAGDGNGPVTSAGVVHDYRLPVNAPVRTVEELYERRLTALGWKLRERLPGLSHHRAGPTLNFEQGAYSVSVNLEGGYDHVLEVVMSKAR
jgi:hypothetical protein